MKQVFQTNDGTVFTEFGDAKTHELTTIENKIGAIIDAHLSGAVPTNPIGIKLLVCDMLTSNPTSISSLLTQYTATANLTPIDFENEFNDE